VVSRTGRPPRNGPLQQFRTFTELTFTPHRALLNQYRRYGSVSVLRNGRKRYVFMLGPDANDFVLSNSDLFSWHESFESLIVINGATALLVSDGAEHRRRRQVLVPKFAQRTVDGYTESIRAAADTVIDGWRRGQRLDLSRELRSMVRRSTIAVLFGPRLAAEEARLGALVDEVLVVVDRAEPLQTLQRWGLPSWRRAVRFRAAVARRVAEEVAHRLRPGAPAPDDGDDVLSLLLAHRAPDGAALTDTEIVDQVISVTAASYVTSSAAMTWIALALLDAPEAWRHCRDSIPDPGWRYLDGTVSEALRLHPPVALLPRAVVSGFEYGGLRVHAGNEVLISPFVTHRIGELFPDPERFDPHRWDPDRPEHRKPGRHEYFPFGGGPHRCLGAGFALAELTVLSEQLLRRTTLRLDDVDATPVGLADMQPRSGPHVTVLSVG
jgi:cytochrome P450